MPLDPSRLLVRGLVASALLLAPQALGQSAQSLFHEAYWLEMEEGRLDRALETYRTAAAKAQPGSALRTRAEERAAGIAEEFAASEFARLVPSDALMFAQIDRPGDQVGKLLDQLGLLGQAHEVSTDRFAVSPLLVENLLGLRGAAVAVTGIGADGEPTGLVLLHPGRHDGLRGLIETALPAGGTPSPSIGGFPVWSVEGEAFVCLTRRLVVAGRDRHQIEGVVARLSGETGDSLADDERFALTFEPDSLGTGLLSFYVNAEPLVPLIEMAAQQQAGDDPGAQMALKMLDIHSLESLSGRIGVDDEGLGLDLALQLAEGHRNLVFNLMRRPTVERETLALVPQGAAFFVATALNPRSDVAPMQSDAADQPVVTALDFGRELFGNVVDLALYGMPTPPGAGEPLPDAALVLRVNDAERSRALWELVLGFATQSQGAEPTQEHVAGVEAERFSIQGMPIWLAAAGDKLVVATRRGTIERALAGAGPSVAGDSVYTEALGLLAASPTFLVAACPGRMIEMARPFLPSVEAAELAPFEGLLEKTSLTLSSQHSSTRLAFGARLRNVPDVSLLVTHAIQQQRQAAVASNGHGHGHLKPASAQTAGAADAKALREELERCILGGNRTGAHHAAQRMIATVEDAKELNNTAWALLTEDRFEGRCDGLALEIARRSNELSGHGNWYYLDTLALAEFRGGDARRAVELQTKVIELAAGDGDHPELRESLERYRAALAAGGSAAGDHGPH